MPNAIDFLLESQNQDGGWGYRRQAMSYVEPTAAVLIALPDSDARRRGRDFLLSLQHSDGGWGIAAIDPDSGWMTSWAVRALAEMSANRDAIMRGANWLLTAKGLKVTNPDDLRIIQQLHHIDGSLVGWPWQDGDATWVHPTALAILALTIAGRADEPRVREGIKYLYDRAVPSGGWNIGNPQMISELIPSTIQDTAVCLLAFHAAKIGTDDQYVIRSIDFMRGALARAKTSAELVWGIYALRNWKAPVGNAVDRLNALQNDDGSWNHNPFITAIAVTSQK
jgi:hypothetical protein